ncbi:MAG: hypothetical protein J6X36_01125 [Lachnospiraceae bacterium]|nr:hypothetical protein [Lachnospiraceae bacterium]
MGAKEHPGACSQVCSICEQTIARQRDTNILRQQNMSPLAKKENADHDIIFTLSIMIITWFFYSLEVPQQEQSAMTVDILS